MNLIKAAIPTRIKKFIQNRFGSLLGLYTKAELRHQIRKELILEREKQEALIPKFELEERHFINLKTLNNRVALLKALPQNAVGAEIGVDKGDFSEEILQFLSPSKLHLIDAWGDAERYHDGLKLVVKDRLSKEIESGLVELNLGYSTEVLQTFPDDYFDWVYIDTDHTYETTAAELSILKSKMRRDGIIAGHDYMIGNWIAGFRYGVIEAVHEFCVKEDWEIIYLTSETSQCRSFAIKKIL